MSAEHAFEMVKVEASTSTRERERESKRESKRLGYKRRFNHSYT